MPRPSDDVADAIWYSQYTSMPEDPGAQQYMSLPPEEGPVMSAVDQGLRDAMMQREQALLDNGSYPVEPAASTPEDAVMMSVPPTLTDAEPEELALSYMYRDSAPQLHEQINQRLIQGEADPPDLQTELLETIQPVEFEYNDPANGPGRHVGVLAQDLQQSEAGASMVNQAPDGTLMVDGPKAATAALGAASDLHERVKNLEFLLKTGGYDRVEGEHGRFQAYKPSGETLQLQGEVAEAMMRQKEENARLRAAVSDQEALAAPVDIDQSLANGREPWTDWLDAVESMAAQAFQAVASGGQSAQE